MTTIQTQVTEFGHAVFGSASHLAKISLAGAERLVGFQFDAARQAVASTGDHVKALTAVKDAQEFAALQRRFAETALESVTAYSQQLYELANETQSQLAEVFESQSSSLYQQAADSAEDFAKALPVGSEAAVAAVKSSVAATTAAVDSIKTSAKQSAKLANEAVKKVAPIKSARSAK